MSSLTSTCTSSSGLIKGQAQELSFIGLVLAALTYGAHITLLLSSIGRIAKRDRRLLLYVLVLFVLATLGLSMHLWWFDEVFNISRQPYEAPMSFITQYVWHPSSMVRAVSYVMLSWFSEGLLYRFYIIYSIMESKSTRAFIATVSSFILLLLIGFPWLSSTCDIPAIVYLSTSSSIHAILTILIVLRIMAFRRRVRVALGSAHGREYASLAEFHLQFVFLPVVGQLQAIPPLLIITRVVEGRALSQKTFPTDTRSSLRFTSVFTPPKTSEKSPELVLPDYFSSEHSDKKSYHESSSSDDIDHTIPIMPPLSYSPCSPAPFYIHDLEIGSCNLYPYLPKINR
ncbi:hypothetical protein K474DRAFT_452838 [Panus rudis PR-1116 ss-1]|nr:hypothetical protein K474DRAFT_452838 [Panus rudis PR-1116 ss-1]